MFLVRCPCEFGEVSLTLNFLPVNEKIPDLKCVKSDLLISVFQLK